MRVEVAVLGSQSLIVLVVSLDVKQYLNLNPHFQSESLSSRERERQTDRQTEIDRQTESWRAGGEGAEIERGGGGWEREGGGWGIMTHSFDTVGGLTEATSLLEREIFNRMTGRKKVNT